MIYIRTPALFWYYLALGVISRRKARHLLERSVAHRPSIPQPYLRLAMLYLRERKWREAIPVLEQATALLGDRAPTNLALSLAIAYQEADEHERAIAILRQLMDSGRDTAEVQLRLAVSFLNSGRLDEALKAARRAHDISPYSVLPLLVLGRIYFTMNDFKSAKAQYEQAVPRLPRPAESFYWLGRSEFELGEVEAAIGHLRSATERIAEHPEMSEVSLSEVREWLELAEEPERKG